MERADGGQSEEIDGLSAALRGFLAYRCSASVTSRSCSARPSRGNAHVKQSGGHAVGVNPVRGRSASFEGDGVYQAALAPGRVQAAIELQRARLADVALEDLGVVSARLDCLHLPLVVEAKARSEFSGAAEQSLDRRYAGGLCHFVRIGAAASVVTYFRVGSSQAQKRSMGLHPSGHQV